MKFKATDRLLLKIRLGIILKLYLDLYLLFIGRSLLIIMSRPPQELSLKKLHSRGSSLYIIYKELLMNSLLQYIKSSLGNSSLGGRGQLLGGTAHRDI
jgi:hypothetical protein